MRLEIVVRFIVVVDEEIAETLEPEGIVTRLGAIAFVDGAGKDRSVVADFDDVIAYTTLAVEVADDPAVLDSTKQIEPRYTREYRDDLSTATADEPIVRLAVGSRSAELSLPTPTLAEGSSLRPLTADEVDFLVECLPETDRSPDDHGSHPEVACAEWVREQQAAGNEWAWCRVRVAARWQGHWADDLLGGCSYESETQFRQPGGYFDDLKATALSRLNAILAATDRRLAPLRAPHSL